MKTALLTGLALSALLTAGCASSANNPGSTSTNGAPARASQSMPGMSMAPGQSMGAGSAAMAEASAPTATAKMVCGDDIKSKVVQVLQLKAQPKTQVSWADRLYTCTYRLPMGPMVLSVKQSTDKAAAAKYFTGLRPTLGRTETTPGLGERAYATGTGIVVVIKDNMTLRVDTTRLPTVFGSQSQKRTDLAYEIASDVLGCWTGDE